MKLGPYEHANVLHEKNNNIKNKTDFKSQRVNLIIVV